MSHFEVFLSQLRLQLQNSHIQRPVRKYLQKNDKYYLSIKTLHIKSNVMMFNNCEK
jgi:hypothetical protein